MGKVIVLIRAVSEVLKSIIPKRIRLLRYDLYEKCKYFPELALSLGSRLQCPFCLWNFRRLKPAGFHYPVLKEKRVVGAYWHTDDVCPRCNSNARERLLYLFLKNRTRIFHTSLRILHIAPEPNLVKAIRTSGPSLYVTGGLTAEGVMARFDILSMPFREDTFDVVICNHVMEHVADDSAAMCEVFRVLRTTGWAVLQVPIALALERTIEDANVKSEEDRIKMFGQRDHVRLYSRNDYLGRLQSAGFTVFAVKYSENLGDDLTRRYGLIKDEEIFIGFRSSSSELNAQLSSGR